MSRRHARFAAVADQRLRWVSVAAEHVHHRHNVSALLRTADAVGVFDVHLVGSRPFRPAKGPARGAERWLRLNHAHTVEEGIAQVKASGAALWVADFAEPPVAPADVPLDRPVCVWFGSELAGVSEVARAAADGVVTIPMRGMAQSLNISVAAALILHTLGERARREHGADALLTQPDRDALLAHWLQRDEVTLTEERARHAALEALGALDTYDGAGPAPGDRD